MSDDERTWVIERTRTSTDYQHVKSWSAAAALEAALESLPNKWLVKHNQADDPNATYVIRPVEVSKQ